MREQILHDLTKVTIGLDAAPAVAVASTLQHRVLSSIERCIPVAVEHLAAQLARDRRRPPSRRDLPHPKPAIRISVFGTHSSWDKNRTLIWRTCNQSSVGTNPTCTPF